jgi:tRNA (cmo5U34)-methyltransferase
MTDVSQPGNFDSQPPVPVTEYEQTVKGVNVGYDLVFTLTYCFLRALRRPDLNLLVVGAGGGMEIERFLPGNPGWHLTGVDPSQDMLTLAEAKAERQGVREQVGLVRGTVETLPAGARFDAATCLFVLHFLPDDGKLALLRGIARQLHPEAPLLVASGCRVEHRGLQDDFLGAWRQHGALMGIPAERMAAIVEQLMAQQPNASSAGDYERLLREAGFQRVAPFFSVMGGLDAWIAR